MPTIEITMPASISCQEEKPVLRFGQSGPELHRGNTLNRCLEHLSTKAKRPQYPSGTTDESCNKSREECNSDSKRTLFSNTPYRLSTEFDTSQISEAEFSDKSFENISVGLSKSMCRPMGKEGTPNKLFLTKEALRPEFTRLCQ